MLEGWKIGSINEDSKVYTSNLEQRIDKENEDLLRKKPSKKMLEVSEAVRKKK